LLRPGGIAREAIERVLGIALVTGTATDHAPVAPGMMTSHYAPKAALRLDADGVQPDEALLAFGPAPSFSGTMYNLSARGDLIEAAANLFSHLRALDASGAKRVAVMKVPHDVQPVGTRRPDRSRGQPFLAFARAGRFRGKARRGNESAARRSWRGDQ
jgi:L-threonylcarbamoyladenylate synthase